MSLIRSMLGEVLSPFTWAEVAALAAFGLAVLVITGAI